MEPLRTVHVGVGGRGASHLKVAAASPRFQVVGLVDITDEPLSAARELTGLGEGACFDSLEAALEGIDADAVVVVTPARLHSAMVRHALVTGHHVMVEKPFTCDLSEAEALVALAQEQGLEILVTQNARLRPGPWRLRQLVAEEDYGPAGLAVWNFFKQRGNPYPYSDHMHLWQQGVHELDTLLSVFAGRQVDQVYGWSGNPLYSDWPSAAASGCVIRFDDGLHCHVTSTSDARARGHLFRVECGEAALIQHQYVGNEIEVLTAGGERELIQGMPVREGETPEETIARWFYEAVAEERESELSGRQNLRTLSLIDAILRSQAAGMPVAPAHP